MNYRYLTDKQVKALSGYNDNPEFLQCCDGLCGRYHDGLESQQALRDQATKRQIHDSLYNLKVATDALPIQAQMLIAMCCGTALEEVSQALDYVMIQIDGDTYAGRPKSFAYQELVDGIPELLKHGIPRSYAAQSQLVNIVRIIAGNAARDLVRKALTVRE